MKSNLSVLFFCISFTLSSCDVWRVAPQPFPVQSPMPSVTPAVVTTTPFIIPPPTIVIIPTASEITVTQSSSPWAETPLPFPSFTPEQPSQTFTPPTDSQPINVEILGCNTSLDVLNGMGEVTNAYVRVKNTGNIDLPNTCALLRAIDEGREHPDKKVCINNIPTQHQVTYKLTVDSTYKKDTIIQVDVTSNETILMRIDKQSCRDISLFGGVPSGIGTVEPIR